MGLFSKLSSLVKKEQTEEDKLIVDLKEALSSLSSAYYRYYTVPGEYGEDGPFLGEKEGNENFFYNVNDTINWLTEALKRSSVIINNLEQQKQVTDYRKKIELPKNQQELLTFLLELEESIKRYVKYLKDISMCVKEITKFSDIGRILEQKKAENILINCKRDLKTSIKQLKAIKKKQNH